MLQVIVLVVVIAVFIFQIVAVRSMYKALNQLKECVTAPTPFIEGENFPEYNVNDAKLTNATYGALAPPTIPEFLFSDKLSALLVFGEIKNLIYANGYVSLGDILDLCDIPQTSFKDDMWGWNSSEGMTITKDFSIGKWMLTLPLIRRDFDLAIKSIKENVSELRVDVKKLEEEEKKERIAIAESYREARRKTVNDINS